jgi:hypothetical protein
MKSRIVDVKNSDGKNIIVKGKHLKERIVMVNGRALREFGFVSNLGSFIVLGHTRTSLMGARKRRTIAEALSSDWIKIGNDARVVIDREKTKVQ